MLELMLHVPIDQLTPHTDPSALNPHPRVGEQQLFVKALGFFAHNPKWVHKPLPV